MLSLLWRSQKINHFNGMLEICRKKSMARNLSKMAKLFPEHYGAHPGTVVTGIPAPMQASMCSSASNMSPALAHVGISSDVQL
jgi:hypothetical protein